MRRAFATEKQKAPYGADVAKPDQKTGEGRRRLAKQHEGLKMDYEIFEFEPGRWSYKVDGTPSGETYPSRAAALIAAEQVRDRQEHALTPDSAKTAPE